MNSVVLKSVDKKTELLISGYFREQLSLVLSSISPTLVQAYRVFPSTLIHMCAIFYLQNADFFDCNNCTKSLRFMNSYASIDTLQSFITEFRNSETSELNIMDHELHVKQKADLAYNTSGSWSTCYGIKKCEIGGNYEWHFKIAKAGVEHSGNSWKMVIGITPFLNKEIRTVNSFVEHNYGFVCSESTFYDRSYSQKNYGRKFEKTNDTMIMKLDLSENVCTLSYVINGIDFGIACKVISEPYKLAVSMCGGRILGIVSSFNQDMDCTGVAQFQTIPLSRKKL